VNTRRCTALALVGAVLLSLQPDTLKAQHASERSASELMDVLMWNREPVGGPFALVDHTGKPATEKRFRGKLLLVYFGFTSCPDVCPTDMQAIGQAIERLGKSGEEVQPVFVTLDPERDTAPHLAEYVRSFHPRFIGLTGDARAIQQAARAYKVYYARVPTRGNGYTVDHSGYIYLMDRDGKYLGFFPPGSPPERMVDVMRPLAREQRP
jgi:cytochrome oxidase Cu insertion factor (SCO1/SenC/PrrC family)